jgi:hypothetical protein
VKQKAYLLQLRRGNWPIPYTDSMCLSGVYGLWLDEDYHWHEIPMGGPLPELEIIDHPHSDLIPSSFGGYTLSFPKRAR